MHSPCRAALDAPDRSCLAQSFLTTTAAASDTSTVPWGEEVFLPSAVLYSDVTPPEGTTSMEKHKLWTGRISL